MIVRYSDLFRSVVFHCHGHFLTVWVLFIAMVVLCHSDVLIFGFIGSTWFRKIQRLCFRLDLLKRALALWYCCFSVFKLFYGRWCLLFITLSCWCRSAFVLADGFTRQSSRTGFAGLCQYAGSLGYACGMCLSWFFYVFGTIFFTLYWQCLLFLLGLMYTFMCFTGSICMPLNLCISFYFNIFFSCLKKIFSHSFCSFFFWGTLIL